MKAIGGYFEINEDHAARSGHLAAGLKFNSGRNALRAMIRARSIQKVYLPFFVCEEVRSAFQAEKVEMISYHINRKLEIDMPSSLADDYVLYVNYFGIKDAYTAQLSKQLPHLIVDNAQSFFSKPIRGKDTIYSPRKFFGLPDGGILCTDADFYMDGLPQDQSEDRMDHLLIRRDEGAEAGFAAYQKNEFKLKDLPVARMSTITTDLLCQLDIDNAKSKRRQNFLKLHESLKDLNQLKPELREDATPLCYPYLVKKGDQLKQKLIQNKVFVPTYWPEVGRSVEADTFEAELAANLVALPIDQRYDAADMDYILKTISEW